jgi:hypothetical protein
MTSGTARKAAWSFGEESVRSVSPRESVSSAQSEDEPDSDLYYLHDLCSGRIQTTGILLSCMQDTEDIEFLLGKADATKVEAVTSQTLDCVGTHAA